MFVFGFLKEWKNDFFKMLNNFLHVESHVEINVGNQSLEGTFWYFLYKLVALVRNPQL